MRSGQTCGARDGSGAGQTRAERQADSIAFTALIRASAGGPYAYSERAPIAVDISPVPHHNRRNRPTGNGGAMLHVSEWRLLGSVFSRLILPTPIAIVDGCPSG